MAEASYTSEQVFSLHPSFQENRVKFEFLIDAYTGAGGYENGEYLDPHTREQRINATTGTVNTVLPKYKDRQRRAYYPNIVKTVTDVPVQYVYQSNIRREGAKEWMDFTKDCDGKKTPFNSSMMKQMRYARLFGVMFYVIDKPRSEIAPATAADEMNVVARAVPVFPCDVIDWCLDEDGDLEWVKILERHDYALDPFSPRQTAYRIRIWTTTEWYLYECDTSESRVSNSYSGTNTQLKFPAAKRSNKLAPSNSRLIAEGSNDLGEVPLVAVYAGDMPDFGEMYSATDIYQSAIINRRIYNMFSELDEIIRDQTFSLLTIPCESVEDVANQVVGTANGMAYKVTQGALKPEYIAPNGECAQTIRNCIDGLKQEIYRAAHLQFAEGVQEVRSGVAKAWNFDETNRFLAGLAMGGETAEKKVGRLVMKLSKSKGYKVQDKDVQVQYPATFNIGDIKEAIETTDLVIAMGISKTLATMAAKDLFSKMHPNVPDAIRKKVEAEIESSPNLEPPAIDAGSSTDAAKGSILARVKAKRGAVKAKQTEGAAHEEVPNRNSAGTGGS